MDSIGALRFADLLANDPLYCNGDMLKFLINSLAIENSIQLYFCGYLYGSKKNPIQRLHTTIEYISYARPIEEGAVSKVEYKQPSVFRPYDKYLKSEIESLEEKFPDEVDYVFELDKMRQRVIRNNSFQVQFVTTILSCNLEFVIGDNTQKLGATQLEGLINCDFNGCLIDALNSFVLISDFISKYFSENLLPLPVSLYPGSSFNTDLFGKKYKISKWDDNGARSDFKQFYSDQSRNRNEALSHSKVESEPKTYSTQEVVKKPTPIVAEIISTNDQTNNAFYKCGQQWEIIFNGKRSLLNDSVGLNYICQIICAGIKGVSVYNLAAANDNQLVSEDNNHFDSPQNVSEPHVAYIKRRIKSISKKDFDKVLEKLKDDKLKLKEKLADGRIEIDDYNKKMKDKNEQISILYNTNRGVSDLDRKKDYDKVTKSIQRALKSIEKNNAELFDHLKRYCKLSDSEYCYTGIAEGVKWKLSQ